MENKNVEEMAEDIFHYFEQYLQHEKVAPTVLGKPDKKFLMSFMGGVTAGMMASNENYNNAKIQDACSLAIRMIIVKYESVKK